MTTTRDEDWMLQAVCAQIDPELWHPDKGHSPKAAKRICATCPVQPACLAYALTDDDLRGVWGGLTQAERRRIPRIPTQGRVA